MRRAAVLAAAFFAGLTLPCRAADMSGDGEGFTFRYDTATWQREPGTPPKVTRLACSAARCGTGTVLTIVGDTRPFSVGATRPFDAAAFSVLLLDPRTERLVPGMRLRPEGVIEPFASGLPAVYRRRYVVEDRDLNRSAMTVYTLRLAGGTASLLLHMPATSPSAEAAAEAVVRSLVPSAQP